MSNKALRNVFVLGSIFFFIIFVALTFDTLKKIDKRAPEITDEINQGKMLWHKYDCIGCHTILGNGSYFAPDLTKTTVNKPKGYVKTFLMNPQKVNPTAVMPALGITDEEAEKLVALLDWVSMVDTNGWPPPPVLVVARLPETGGVLIYNEQGCSDCHMIGGIGGTSGPDLTNIGSKYPRQWHIYHFKDPKAVVPDSIMPSYGHLSNEDIGLLTEHMLSLKQEGQR